MRAEFREGGGGGGGTCLGLKQSYKKIGKPVNQAETSPPKPGKQSSKAELKDRIWKKLIKIAETMVMGTCQEKHQYFIE
jgi:hypothetical protein